MKKTLCIVLTLVIYSFIYGETMPTKINFNDDWYFILSDNASYSAADFNHNSWRKLDLPHDWSIEGAYSKSNPMGATCGYLPAGIGFYRKSIAVPAAWKGSHVTVSFDGVFMNSTVWANGQELGVRPYGWVSFAYDISEIANNSDYISFAVRVDNAKQPSARWYTGSGIYADTWIEVTHPVRINREGGIFIRTNNNQISIDTDISNQSNDASTVILKTTIVDKQGVEVNRIQNTINVNSLSSATEHQELVISDPNLWSINTPYLYTAVSEIWKNDVLLDVVKTAFGVRDIKWIPESGMWINGENIKLQGVCNHQDAGALGAAVPDKILRYRIQQLKDMGCNAIRTAHNPQTPKFYSICDELGMLVMDEVFDGWKQKATNDYGAHSFATWWTRDVTDWIKRDRNHPSVVIYSVGNETSGTVGQQIVNLCHVLDPSRPVTSGHSGSDYMDVLGVNGASEKLNYVEDLAKDRVIIGTENTHTWQVRGYYRTKTWYRDGSTISGLKVAPDLTQEEVFTNDWILNQDRTISKQVFNSSYDNALVRQNSRASIEQIRDIPNFAGSFRWTGYDYIGEASYVHGGWPFRAFMGGAIDLANFEKDLYYLYQSQWSDKPMLHILPHWTHPVMETNTKIPVWVYSNCDEVELFLNGVSLGRKTPGTTRDNMQCEWLVPWQAGELKAVAYKNGISALERSVVTAHHPTQNKLSIDGEGLSTTEKDIVQVRVAALDSVGNFYPYGENRSYFHVIGPGRIRALDNGSPVDVEKHYGVSNRIAFYGLTRAYIESTGEAGNIHLLVSAILGEKKQITSNKVSIDARILTLRGSDISPEIKIYYTTDGNEPSTSSTLYTENFTVSPGTTVKALVMLDGDAVQQLSERFAEDEGFVWNDPDYKPEPTDPTSLQAEDAAFDGASIKTSGKGFKGTGFLDFGQNLHGYVEWYRENDGDAVNEMLNIRYSCNTGGTGRLINVIVNDEQIATNLLLPNTGSWGNDWDSVSVAVNIKMGGNTIRLSNPATGGAYIDQISFSTLTGTPSLGESSLSKAFIFPNPVKDQLTIVGVDSPTWSIYNTLGIELFSGVGNFINVSNLLKANYLIKIEDSSDGVIVRRFVK